MKASELRIGNYFKGVNNIMQIGASDFYRLESEDYTYDPIPLTEEWLKRFGFEKDGNEFTLITIKNYFDINKWGDGNFHFVCNSGDSDTHIEFVHQLQNIYFALTGKELILSDAS